ncbi:signal peptidase I [Enterococcus sp. LJL51]|uniref:signal peptidase I n=1 Tax=Enterococcus sp. LJL51 TaxID=3416656 RepID=UPI003CF7E192
MKEEQVKKRTKKRVPSSGKASSPERKRRKQPTKHTKRKKKNEPRPAQRKRQTKPSGFTTGRAVVGKNQPRKRTSGAGKGMKGKKRLRKKGPKHSLLKDLLLAFAITTLLLTIVIGSSFRFPKMTGYSMATTVNDKDRLIVNKWKGIKRFRLVYFNDPKTGERSIKRVIGLPGEHVAYKNDELFIDYKLVPERFLEAAAAEAKSGGYILTEDFTLQQVSKQPVIPEGQYLVLGDNRKFSIDSRNYGLINKKDIIGVVELRLLPFHTARYF